MAARTGEQIIQRGYPLRVRRDTGLFVIPRCAKNLVFAGQRFLVSLGPHQSQDDIYEKNGQSVPP